MHYKYIFLGEELLHSSLISLEEIETFYMINRRFMKAKIKIIRI